jgi:uncharacterized protein with FMN-binding domain
MRTRSRAARLIPALIVAAATALPAVTAAEILTHVAPSSILVALGPRQSSGQSAGSPPSTPASGSPTPAGASSGGGATATQAATAAAGTTRTYTGAAMQNRFGTVQATLVVTGNRITDVIITAPQDNGRSAYINSQAVPILRSETLQAQSANVNSVSGATYTSESYIGSLQDALVQAHL